MLLSFHDRVLLPYPRRDLTSLFRCAGGRCTALVLSVSHLVLITKNACRLSGVLDWIDQSLADVDDHLRVRSLVTLEAVQCTYMHRRTLKQSYREFVNSLSMYI